MRRLRAVTWAGGVGLAAVTFAGAAKLLDSPSTAPLPAPPAGLVGTTVHGQVDSEPSPIRVGPPAVAGLATVDRVFVKDGQEVRAGDELVQFEDRVLRAKLDQAKGKQAAAEAQAAKARQARKVQAARVDAQNLAIKAAADTLRAGEEAQRRGKEAFEKFLTLDRNRSTGQPLTEEEKARQRQENPELINADTLLTSLRNKLEGERKTLAVLEANPVEADVRAAEADAVAAAGLVAEAEAAVDACLVRARVAGVVEQLDAAPGVTYGPASRNPLLLLVPTGTRLVWAEVDPEFAYRVADKTGARVTVTDFTNTALTYPGVVRRVGTAFVAKRSAPGALALDPPKALECVVELPDPAPAGKPPLRVNQPVRVIFPQ